MLPVSVLSPSFVTVPLLEDVLPYVVAVVSVPPWVLLSVVSLSVTSVVFIVRVLPLVPLSVTLVVLSTEFVLLELPLSDFVFCISLYVCTSQS